MTTTTEPLSGIKGAIDDSVSVRLLVGLGHKDVLDESITTAAEALPPQAKELEKLYRGEKATGKLWSHAVSPLNDEKNLAKFFDIDEKDLKRAWRHLQLATESILNEKLFGSSKSRFLNHGLLRNQDDAAIRIFFSLLQKKKTGKLSSYSKDELIKEIEELTGGRVTPSSEKSISGLLPPGTVTGDYLKEFKEAFEKAWKRDDPAASGTSAGGDEEDEDEEEEEEYEYEEQQEGHDETEEEATIYESDEDDHVRI